MGAFSSGGGGERGCRWMDGWMEDGDGDVSTWRGRGGGGGDEYCLLLIDG